MSDYERNADASKTLTEQWKKGELPDGFYWVEGSRAEGIYAYTAEYLNHMYRPKNSDRIIEQVPSYEQWQAKLEENTDLKKDFKLMKRLLRRMEESDNAREKFQNGRIEKLKELLKECKALLSCLQIDDYDNNGLLILNKINQALGEE